MARGPAWPMGLYYYYYYYYYFYYQAIVLVAPVFHYTLPPLLHRLSGTPGPLLFSLRSCSSSSWFFVAHAMCVRAVLFFVWFLVG